MQQLAPEGKNTLNILLDTTEILPVSIAVASKRLAWRFLA
jgi:hypothetical protein